MHRFCGGNIGRIEEMGSRKTSHGTQKMLTFVIICSRNISNGSRLPNTWTSLLNNCIDKMYMESITIKIPATLQMSSFEIEMLVASRLFEQGKLSSGQAADMVGLSKRTFLELMGKYGVSIFGYDVADIENDLKNA